MNATPTTFDQLVTLLETNQAQFRVLEHEPEGRTEVITHIRGNRLSQAVKSMVLQVKLNKKESRYVLANVPGDCRVDLNAVKALYAAASVNFAPKEKLEALTGCVLGAVPPFSFNPELPVLLDETLLGEMEFVFNAGCLDRSVFVARDDYLRIVQPQIVKIASKTP